MNRTSILRCTVGVVTVLGLSVGTARADFLQNLSVGLRQFDYFSSLERNRLGNGWEFNTSALYNGQTFRMGLADLTLGGTSSALVNMRAGYTLRGLPSAHFALTTSDPLSYTFNANYGLQDFVATGNIFIRVNTEINLLGFYDQTFMISNRGTFTTDGFGPTDAGTLDFDAGPIVVSGNIYADILAVLTQPFFDATATQNPFAKFSQRATKIVGMSDADALRQQIAAGEKLSVQDMGRVINNSILAAVLGQEPSADLFGDLLSPDGLLALQPNARRFSYLQVVPEPATLAMMVVPLLFITAIPRRRNRAN